MSKEKKPINMWSTKERGNPWEGFTPEHMKSFNDALAKLNKYYNKDEK